LLGLSSTRQCSPLCLCTPLLLILGAILSLALPSCASVGSAKGKNVLVLFGSNRPDNREFLDLVEAEIRLRIPEPVTFYQAYLTTDPDLDRYRAYEQHQAEAFQQTYGWMRIDLVIAVYAPAVEFALKYRDQAFPGALIMFAGIGIKSGWDRNYWPGLPGVMFAVGVGETIDLILKLHPDTKRVALVAGPDWGWIKEIHSELARQNLETVDIIFLDPSPEMVQKVAALPPHTVALLHTTIAPVHSEFGSRELIAGVSNTVPTYSAWEYTCLGFGCIGGAYADDEKSAASVAQIASRILSGERPENIPPVYNADLRATVDWSALQRWHIPESALPPGTLVLHREPTLWERGRKYFLAAIAIIFVQTLLVLSLFWQRAQNKRTELQLKQSEETFSKSFRHSPLLVTITSTKDSRFIDVNESFEEQLGWTRNEVIGRTPLDFDLWVDIDQRNDFLKQLQITGSVRNLEVRLRKKDGESRTTLISAELIEIGGEPCTVSVVTDITQRKQAEEILSTASRRLIEAQEQERTRIARELHDDINQRLALVAVMLTRLKKDTLAPDSVAKEDLEQVRQEILELGRDVQGMSHRLHSSKLEYLGLSNAAGAFCREFSERHNVEVEFHSENVPKQLSPEISLCLFRVLQEALQNAAKYSGMQRFLASLEASEDEIRLVVRDFGEGFDPESAINQQGIGLISMRERLKLVEGQLNIDSHPKQGTTICASVPLAHKTTSVAVSN